MKTAFKLSCDGISVSYFNEQIHACGLSGDHCHDKYEITCLLCASGRYIVEGREHKISEGTVAFISPMTYHKVELDFDKPTEGYTVYFSPSTLNEPLLSMLDSIIDGGGCQEKFYNAAHLGDALISVFDRFSAAERLDGKAMESYMQALLCEIIILLSALKGEKSEDDDSELGARVARYLNANFKKNVSLDRLARRFFVSKYYLCRAFKNYSGISVHAYINQKRIVFAKSLIESGMTAAGAAEKVGYGDYSAFYRAYVKILGKSPTAQ